MLMTTDPGRPRARPDVRLGHDRVRRRAVGAALDHDRHVPGRARARPAAADGGEVPVLPARRLGRGSREGSDAQRAPLPPSDPTTDDIRHGFVYERVQHITLKSIANNPDINEGMSREEIDAAIKRHADFELLYDKPYEDKQEGAGRRAVHGREPVAAPLARLRRQRRPTAPAHRATADGPRRRRAVRSSRRSSRTCERPASRTAARTSGSSSTWSSPTPATYIQAVGERDGGEARRRSGSGSRSARSTARSARRSSRTPPARRSSAGDLDLLCVLGVRLRPAGARRPTTSTSSRDEGLPTSPPSATLGRIPVLLVRMNADLVMGEELKKTGAGNLFTVFGEPDIEIDRQASGDEVRVELRGVDVYDPTTGEVRSSDTDQIALWMIDTDYDGESFFVRHCYFTGGQDPYKRLKRRSRPRSTRTPGRRSTAPSAAPFARPETGKIAVKVINDYGDEVMKVFDVT